MRLFLGIEIPSPIKKELDQLFFGLPGANWVNKEQLHITLRFIGEIDRHQMKDIDDSLKLINFPTFPIKLKRPSLNTQIPKAPSLPKFFEI